MLLKTLQSLSFAQKFYISAPALVAATCVIGPIFFLGPLSGFIGIVTTILYNVIGLIALGLLAIWVPHQLIKKQLKEIQGNALDMEFTHSTLAMINRQRLQCINKKMPAMDFSYTIKLVDDPKVIAQASVSTIFLSHKIMARLNDKETAAILAHEMAHIRHSDSYCNVALFLTCMAAVLCNPIHPVVVAPICLIWFSSYQKYAEYQADAFAAKICGKDAMAQALRKIVKVTQSEEFPQPGRLLELFLSHPTIDKRVARLEKLNS